MLKSATKLFVILRRKREKGKNMLQKFLILSPISGPLRHGIAIWTAMLCNISKRDSAKTKVRTR